MLPSFKLFKRKPKEKDFLILEIGLEKVNCAIFEKEGEAVKLKGVGRKKFSSQEEVFDSCLESLDALAAIVPDLPTKGILGISGGSLETITTIARYNRPHPKAKITPKETANALDQVVANLDTSSKKIFFSNVAGGQIDGVKVTNPIGLKGERVELSCFAAFKDAEEIALLDRIVSEIDLKVEKIIPTSFTVAKILEHKNLKNALLFRAGLEKSEPTVLVDGHVSEILPVDLGAQEPEFLLFALAAALKDIEKDKKPALVWLFADNDEIDLTKLKEIFLAFPWTSQLGFEVAPKVEVAEGVANFSPSDIGIYALSQQEEVK